MEDYYGNKDFGMCNVRDISKEATKEDELFDYADVPSYLKNSIKSFDDKNKCDYEMSL